MTTRLATLDRVLVLLFGLLLLAGGGLAVAWAADLIALDPAPVAEAAGAFLGRWWWAWAVAVPGLLLGLVAVRWLVAHLSQRTSSRLALAGSEPGSRLEADVAVAARQAADHARGPGVRSVSSRVTTERGQSLVELTATVDAREGSLRRGAQALDRAGQELAQVLGETCPPVRGWVRVERA